ncbi:MAG: hypothetical protein C0190_02170 [Thermodesulfobacterium geofontis]|uniref:Uncharacterized protein n=1 Tax=Thermodesulfobacterium geofontis TaxID=1295609 RepID=A0A2N7PPF7_9BACT|nr:MAG: hypothetical protein C0190_02170 [Thermodesulfobacterium geofontis]PMP93662.1 MAG: hypothetical protein C0169_07485 [Thermodesulfobacterium geofontis]
MVEKIELENGLTLEIWNYSRKLAGDRWLVGFLAQIGITPSESDFSNSEYYKKFLEKTDGKVYYRYRKERHFVPEDSVATIYSNIKENFLKAALPYLSHPDFKERLLKHEVKQFEKQIDWEEEIKRKDEETEKLEEIWKDKKIF